MRRHIPKKAVCVPCSLPVDISAFLPIVDHPLFQKLRWRKQLGVNSLVFPGAVHTRFEHALGVLGLTSRLCEIHDIRGADRRKICGYALVHDIGHGPFSHQIEPVSGDDHNQQGANCMKRMASALQACKLDVDEMVAFFENHHPLKPYVSDRNLGTDKLDYLRRDALHIGFTGMPDVEKILLYAFLQDGTWMVEERYIEDVKRIQKFYSYLHQHGYLNKTALAVQRVFQRAVEEELRTASSSANALWDMTDDDLMDWLKGGRSKVAKQLLGTLVDRTFHRSFYVIKPAGYAYVERTSTKHVALYEWSRSQIRTFSMRHSDCTNVTQLEDDLNDALGLPRATVLLAAMPYFSKLIPRDVRIYSSQQNGSFWLFRKDKDHYRSVEGDYLRTFAIRLIAPPAVRDELVKRHSEITELLESRI